MQKYEIQAVRMCPGGGYCHDHVVPEARHNKNPSCDVTPQDGHVKAGKMFIGFMLATAPMQACYNQINNSTNHPIT
jgi:hypothetical protein